MPLELKSNPSTSPTHPGSLAHQQSLIQKLLKYKWSMVSIHGPLGYEPNTPTTAPLRYMFFLFWCTMIQHTVFCPHNFRTNSFQLTTNPREEQALRLIMLKIQIGCKAVGRCCIGKCNERAWPTLKICTSENSNIRASVV